MPQTDYRSSSKTEWNKRMPIGIEYSNIWGTHRHGTTRIDPRILSIGNPKINFIILVHLHHRYTNNIKLNVKFVRTDQGWMDICYPFTQKLP